MYYVARCLKELNFRDSNICQEGKREVYAVRRAQFKYFISSSLGVAWLGAVSICCHYASDL